MLRACRKLSCTKITLKSGNDAGLTSMVPSIVYFPGLCRTSSARSQHDNISRHTIVKLDTVLPACAWLGSVRVGSYLSSVWSTRVQKTPEKHQKVSVRSWFSTFLSENTFFLCLLCITLLGHVQLLSRTGVTMGNIFFPFLSSICISNWCSCGLKTASSQKFRQRNQRAR